MTQIKKILDKQGNEVFIRTSTKAVVDGNGYTAESRLQAMQDEINQAQLEVGAVPSDLTPTINSTNWVTSGGVFNATNIVDTESVDLSQFEEVAAWIGSNGDWISVGNEANRGKFLPTNNANVLSFTAQDDGYSYFAFLKSATFAPNTTPDYATGETNRRTKTAGTTGEFIIPDDCNYIWVATHSSSAPDAPKAMALISHETLKDAVVGILTRTNQRTIYPLFTYDTIRGSNGEFSTNTVFSNLQSSTTPRFVKTSKPFAITSNVRGAFRIYYYDSNFGYLGTDAESTELVANNSKIVSLAYSCSYVKIAFYNTNTYIPQIKLQGDFQDDWDTFNPRPSDDGYHRISVIVNVTDPTCCDTVTDDGTVEDSPQLLPDYGVICLPPTYTNSGEPTRLIIYCHGAAVNYADDVTRFNSQDLEPEYWLAEGYAVMDIEGNPFDNTNEHICIPQTMDCYVAGYKWAIEHYNLRRDGIFVGGRSMGGQNTFNLIRRECPIPVIAACPNSPAPDLSFGYGDKTRKEFCALHMGFVVPSGFTWSNGTLTANEIQVLKDNWDKYIKCCPELTACLNLPDKDTLLENPTGTAKIELWSTLHMVAKCPVKIFGCNQDPSCPPASTSALLYKMLMNSGQMAELRLFNSNKDYTGTGTSAHHYDTQDPALRTTVTTRYGEVMTNVPVVYVEMLQFWRRYEQGN